MSRDARGALSAIRGFVGEARGGIIDTLLELAPALSDGQPETTEDIVGLFRTLSALGSIDAEIDNVLGDGQQPEGSSDGQ